MLSNCQLPGWGWEKTGRGREEEGGEEGRGKREGRRKGKEGEERRKGKSELRDGRVGARERMSGRGGKGDMQVHLQCIL